MNIHTITGFIEIEEKLLTNEKAVINMVAKNMLEELKNYIKIKVIDSPSSDKKRVLYIFHVKAE